MISSQPKKKKGENNKKQEGEEMGKKEDKLHKRKNQKHKRNGEHNQSIKNLLDRNGIYLISNQYEFNIQRI